MGIENTEWRGLEEFLRLNGWTMESGQIKLLHIYGRMLLEGNRLKNLTSITEEREVWRKHFLDSLLLFFAVEVSPGAQVVDVGSGAGLPGIVLKIYRQDLQVTLVEASRKKAEFAKRVIGILGLKGIVSLWARAEDLGRRSDFREKFEVAVSRGVAAMSVLLEYCLPLVKVGGKVVAYKGPRADEEVKEAGRALQILGGEIETVWSGRLPEGGEERRLVVIRKVAPTDTKWPRRPGVPEKRPL